MICCVETSEYFFWSQFQPNQLVLQLATPSDTKLWRTRRTGFWMMSSSSFLKGERLLFIKSNMINTSNTRIHTNTQYKKYVMDHWPSENGDLQQLAWVPTHQSCRIYFTQIKIGVQKFSPIMRKLQLMHIPSLLGVPCIYGGDPFSIWGQLECLARLTISAKNLAVEGRKFP